MKWRIYYDGDVTVDSDNVPVENATVFGVMAIVQDCPDVKWQILSHADYYVWSRERWCGVDYPGLIDYLQQPGWKRVLFGRTILSSEFTAIFNRANNDRAFGEKKGFLPREIKPND